MADLTLKRGASAAFTISLASLATSATLVAGQESNAIVTPSTQILDYLVGGKIRVGTTPTINTVIQIWVYSSIDDTPTYPDVFDGTDSAETITGSSVGVRDGAIKLGAIALVDSTTSDRDYWFAPFSIAMLHGGALPKAWGLFVTHNTGVNLNATGGNHVLSYTPIYGNVA